MDYSYDGTCVRVIDGDTVELKIDLGFRMWFVTKARLAGIQAPELKTGTPGAKAKAMPPPPPLRPIQATRR